MMQYNLSHWSILQGYPRVFLRYRNTADRIAAAGMDPNQAEKQSWRDIVQLCRRVGASTTSYGNIGRKNTTRIVCRSCCREIITKRATLPVCRACRQKNDDQDPVRIMLPADRDKESDRTNL